MTQTRSPCLPLVNTVDLPVLRHSRAQRESEFRKRHLIIPTRSTARLPLSLMLRAMNSTARQIELIYPNAQLATVQGSVFAFEKEPVILWDVHVAADPENADIARGPATAKNAYPLSV